MSGLEEEEQRLEKEEMEAMTGDIHNEITKITDNTLELQEKLEKNARGKKKNIRYFGRPPEEYMIKKHISDDDRYFSGEAAVYRSVARQQADEADVDLKTVDDNLNRIIRKRIKRSLGRREQKKVRKMIERAGYKGEGRKGRSTTPIVEGDDKKRFLKRRFGLSDIFGKKKESREEKESKQNVASEKTAATEKENEKDDVSGKENGSQDEKNVQSQNTETTKDVKEKSPGESSKNAKKPESNNKDITREDDVKEKLPEENSKNVKKQDLSNEKITKEDEKDVSKKEKEKLNEVGLSHQNNIKTEEIEPEAQEKKKQIKKLSPESKTTSKEENSPDESLPFALKNNKMPVKAKAPKKNENLNKGGESQEKDSAEDNLKALDSMKQQKQQIDDSLKNNYKNIDKLQNEKDEHATKNSLEQSAIDENKMEGFVDVDDFPLAPTQKKTNIDTAGELDKDEDYSNIENEIEDLLREKLEQKDETPNPKKTLKQQKKDEKEFEKDKKEINMEDFAMNHANRIRIGPLFELTSENDQVEAAHLRGNEARMQAKIKGVSETRIKELIKEIDLAEKELAVKSKQNDDENTNIDVALGEIARDYNTMRADETNIINKFQRHAMARKRKKLKRQEATIKYIQDLKKKEQERINQGKKVLPKEQIKEDEVAKYDRMLAKVMEGWVR